MTASCRADGKDLARKAVEVIRPNAIGHEKEKWKK
jgi:hypothetical protein